MQKHFYKALDRIFAKIIIEGDLSKTYGFYRSSGRHSAYSKTWFPCRGMDGSPWIIKPNTVREDQQIERYGNEFVSFLKKQSTIKTNKKSLQSLLGRFGNIECMLISYAIGGGFWEDPDSFYFKLAIKRCYLPQLLILKNTLSDLDEFRDPKSQYIIELNLSRFHSHIDNEENKKKEEEEIEKINQLNQYLFGENISISDLKENQHYEAMAFNYDVPKSISDKTVFLNKWNLLLQVCMDYKKHLITHTSFFEIASIREKKLKAIDILCNNLLAPNDISEKTLDEFSKQFNAVKPVLLQSRDNKTLKFIKCILTILSFGLAHAFGIWNVEGQKVTQELENILHPISM